MKKACILILLMMLAVTGCKREHSADSTLIEKKDLQLSIPNDFLKDGQKIKDMEEASSFSLTYIMDAGMEYCCVNMESFLIYMVTDANMKATSMEGIADWLYDYGLRVSMSEENAKATSDGANKRKITITDVYCEAILAQEYYEDFTGQVVFIEDTYRSIGLFVGAKGLELKLTGDQKDLIQSITDSLTTTKDREEQIKDRVQITKTLKQDAAANVSFVNQYGILDLAELDKVTVSEDVDAYIKKEQSRLLDKEIPKAPSGYQWQMVTMTGENVEYINPVVKDDNGNTYETGSRTYTILLSENKRTDIYLIPTTEKSYVLEFGEIGHKGTFGIKI